MNLVKMSVRTGSVLLFIFGVLVVCWLNMAVPPEYVLVFRFPDLFWQIILGWFMMPIYMFLVIAFLLWKYAKGIRPVWFFFGASLTSLFYAVQSLEEIAVLYYWNVGRYLPDIRIEGYSFPAIYTFKLFRSIFFTTFFGILGYSVEILRTSQVVQVVAKALARIIDWIQQQLKKMKKKPTLSNDVL